MWCRGLVVGHSTQVREDPGSNPALGTTFSAWEMELTHISSPHPGVNGYLTIDSARYCQIAKDSAPNRQRPCMLPRKLSSIPVLNWVCQGNNDCKAH